MIDIVEILIGWHAGRPKAEIAHSLGVDRRTVRRYVAAAEAAGITPGGEPLSHEQWAARAREWFPELLAPELRCPSFAQLGRFHDTIKTGLGTDTASVVWQRLRDEESLQASLASSPPAASTPRCPNRPSARRSRLGRDDPPPGQEAQIDYGCLGRWTDPATGHARRVWALLMVLAASRHMFALPAAGDDAGRLDRRARRRVRLLRRHTGPAGPRQPQSRSDQGGPV